MIWPQSAKARAVTTRPWATAYTGSPTPTSYFPLFWLLDVHLHLLGDPFLARIGSRDQVARWRLTGGESSQHFFQWVLWIFSENTRTARDRLIQSRQFQPAEVSGA